MDHCTPNPKAAVVTQPKLLNTSGLIEAPISFSLTGPSMAAEQLTRACEVNGSSINYLVCHLLRSMCECCTSSPGHRTCDCSTSGRDKRLTSARDFRQCCECIRPKLPDIYGCDPIINRHVYPDNMNEADYTLSYHNSHSIHYELLPDNSSSSHGTNNRLISFTYFP